MMLGGSPSQLVWMITWTSEMSGSASSGMWPMAQIPAITNSNTPVKTRNRLRAHHSMTRLITLHSSRRIECEVFAHDYLSVLSARDRHLPRAARSQIAAAFIEAASLVTRMDRRFHGSHSHLLHSWHEECDGHLRASNRLSVARSELDANRIAAFVWWRRIGRQFDRRLRLCRRVHGGRCARSRRWGR